MKNIFCYIIILYAGIFAMIMAFHLTGRFIETAAKERASQAIRKLIQLGAKTACLLRVGKDTFLSEVGKDYTRL